MSKPVNLLGVMTAAAVPPAVEPPNVLVIDIGGTNVKLLMTGQTSTTKFASGSELTPQEMVAGVKQATADWDYSFIAMGFPAPVVRGRILHEPVNLGRGWTGFDFAQAFGKPVRIANDATMQAIGSYTEGRMFFIGLGTGMGSAMVDHGYPISLEMGHLPFKQRTFEQYVGARALKRAGRERWERRVHRIAEDLCDAFVCDYVVLGGGNAKLLTSLPPRGRLGDNANAFKGGFRMWETTRESGA
jgi:polyphosphate glucokinase